MEIVVAILLVFTVFLAAAVYVKFREIKDELFLIRRTFSFRSMLNETLTNSPFVEHRFGIDPKASRVDEICAKNFMVIKDSEGKFSHYVNVIKDNSPL